MSLTHKACDGELTVDYEAKGFVDAETQETYYPVKCSKCGHHLGLLAEVEDKCQVH